MIGNNQVTEVAQIGDIRGNTITVVDDGKLLDTKVLLHSGVLCWITHDSKDKFLEEINEVITKYRM